jgi:hypothetical protein
MNNFKCVVKFEYYDGVKLKRPKFWCGENKGGFYYVDANHAALASRSDVCEKCKAEIIKALN